MNFTDEKAYNHIFEVLLGGVVTLMAASLMVFYSISKDKTDFEHITGVVTSITESYPYVKDRHPGEHRFIKLNNYPVPFEVFVGKGPYDTSPRLERVGELKSGDTITVYCDDLEITTRPVNLTAGFIDKNGTSYFEEGNTGGIIVAWLGVTISLVLAAGAYFLKFKGYTS